MVQTEAQSSYNALAPHQQLNFSWKARHPTLAKSVTPIGMQLSLRLKAEISSATELKERSN
jgi:hypothetical protein